MRVIGGEFEIDPGDFLSSRPTQSFEFDKGYFYSSGRAALYHIWSSSVQKRKKRILLPEYLCHSIVEIAKLLKINFQFYSLNHDLTLNIRSVEEIYTEDCSILIINYFGGIDVQNEIKRLKKIDSDISITVDNVQALYSMFDELDVDFMFTSFRKHLPVPDGSWVVSKFGLAKSREENSFAKYKLAGGLLKSFQKYQSVTDKVYLDLFAKGEDYISKNIRAKISDISIEILSKLDLNAIKNTRLENAAFMIEGLREIGIKPLLKFKSNMIPLFIPVTVKNRDLVRQRLKDKNIFCPIHWPRSPDLTTKDHKLYDQQLSLVIDQRYSFTDIRSIVETVGNCVENES